MDENSDGSAPVDFLLTKFTLSWDFAPIYIKLLLLIIKISWNFIEFSFHRWNLIKKPCDHWNKTYWRNWNKDRIALEQMLELNTYSISVFMVPITNCHYHVGGWHDTWRKPFFDNKWPINTIGTLCPDMGMIPKGSFWQGLNLWNIFQIHKSQDNTGL